MCLPCVCPSRSSCEVLLLVSGRVLDERLLEGREVFSFYSFASSSLVQDCKDKTVQVFQDVAQPLEDFHCIECDLPFCPRRLIYPAPSEPL